MGDSDDRVKTEILNQFTLHMGNSTSMLYQEFYKKQDIQTVLTSAKELLTELLGPQKGHDIILSITNKYHLNTSNL